MHLHHTTCCMADALCEGGKDRAESQGTAAIVREDGHLPGPTEVLSRTTGTLEVPQEEVIILARCSNSSDGLAHGWWGVAM